MTDTVADKAEGESSDAIKTPEIKPLRLKLMVSIWAVAFLVIYVGWFAFVALRYKAIETEDDLPLAGMFGDSFGTINALFAGAALIAVAISIYQTKYQIKQTQVEMQQNTDMLRQQRDEMKLQHKEMVAQNKFLKRRSYEEHFFQLLASWQSILGRLVAEGIIKDFWDVLEGDTRKDIQGNTGTEYEQRIRAVMVLYRLRAQKRGYELGHFFRLLYHLTRYVDECKEFNEDDKYRYMQMVRAHMSESELALLFYNSYLPKSKGMHPFIRKFRLLHNMEHLPTNIYDKQYYKELTGVDLDKRDAEDIDN